MSPSSEPVPGRFGPDWFLRAPEPCPAGPEAGTGPAAVPELCAGLIDGAIAQGVSDIHFEPEPDRFAVRYRLNGTLVNEVDLDPALHPRVTSHLKTRADLDITERRRPQDGRIGWEGERAIDLRVSTVPGAHGEKTVLRILDPERLPSGLAELGMDARSEQILTDAAARSRGLVLVTGPTGSGKSTTLYVLLRSVDRVTRNVMSVEDPVEYLLEGTTQVSVDARVGRTFAGVLRSFLRQDPDILMVGEVRDLETAEMCIRASLTGHLVLSTLHTNDSAGAVVRLIDMGIPPFLLASSLSVICSQRLLRRVCEGCAVPDPEGTGLLARYGLELPDRAVGMRGEGCAACRSTGVGGRVGIFETLRVSSEIEEAVRRSASSSEIAGIARSQGTVGLIEQGLRLVTQGRVAAGEMVHQILSANTIEVTE